MGYLKLSRLDQAFLSCPIAHRGMHDFANGVVENSFSAFARAIRYNYPIECDLQCTFDDMAVVFHDETLDRMTDQKGFVNEKTLSEITQIKLKNSIDKIQSLKEFLAQINGSVPLLIEIKDQSGELGPKLGGFINDIISTLKLYNGIFAIMSFNPHVISHLRQQWPGACLGLTTDNFSHHEWENVPRDRVNRLNKLSEVDGLEIDFISHNWLFFNSVKHINLPKICWTIRNQEQADTALKFADNITFEGYMPKGL